MSPLISLCLTLVAAAVASALPMGMAQQAAASPGAQNAPADAAAEVTLLVDQLQDPVFARRQAAAASLLKLPESSAPLLSKLQSAAPPQTAERLETIQQSLRQRWFRERLSQLEQNALRTLPDDFPCSKQLS
ncbi:MAG: hypothetical protein RL215_3165, partial [Planctomycetota bacterium]